MGERLKEARQKSGMTQREAARLIGVSMSRIADWEAGNTKPRIEKLPLIAWVYNVSLDWLLGVEK